MAAFFACARPAVQQETHIPPAPIGGAPSHSVSEQQGSPRGQGPPRMESCIAVWRCLLLEEKVPSKARRMRCFLTSRTQEVSFLPMLDRQPAGCGGSAPASSSASGSAQVVRHRHLIRHGVAAVPPSPQGEGVSDVTHIGNLHLHTRPDVRRTSASGRKTPEPKLRGFLMSLQLHGEPGRQRAGDRIDDRLCLLFAAILKDLGSQAETSLNDTHSRYFTPFIRFPTPSHTTDDIGCWLVLPVTSSIISKNRQNTTDTS